MKIAEFVPSFIRVLYSFQSLFSEIEIKIVVSGGRPALLHFVQARMPDDSNENPAQQQCFDV